MNAPLRLKKAALLGPGLVLSMLAAASAYAQEGVRTFHIAAEPLAKALVVFSEQSGLAVMAPADLVRDRTAPAAEGNIPPLAALDWLLKASGLKYLHNGDGTLTIAPAGSSKTNKNGRGASQAGGGSHKSCGSYRAVEDSIPRQLRRERVAKHFDAAVSPGTRSLPWPLRGKGCPRGSLAATRVEALFWVT